MRRIAMALALLLGISPLARAEESVLEKLDREVRQLADRAGAAVVRVSVEREIEFPGPEETTQPFVRKVSRIGTGFIVDNDGYVLTTHQLAEGAESAQVSFANGEKRDATILGSDPFFKVAVLKTTPVAGTIPLEFREDDQPAFATVSVFLGHSFGIHKSISFGFVTGSRRSGYPFDRFDNFVTVNTTVNPGDTGGPFLDAKGRVIGMAVEARANVINIFGRSGAQGGVIRGFPGTGGPAFAIPAPDLEFAMDEIKAHGRVRSGRLGVLVWRKTLKVRTVRPDTPAEKIGLEPDDTILEVNDQRVNTGEELSFALRRTLVGKSLRIKYLRGEEKRIGSAVFEEYVPPTISPLPGISVTIGQSGITVSSVDGKALFAVKVGDRILKVDGESLQSGDDLTRVLAGTKGRPKQVVVLRGGMVLTLSARVEK